MDYFSRLLLICYIFFKTIFWTVLDFLTLKMLFLLYSIGNFRVCGRNSFFFKRNSVALFLVSLITVFRVLFQVLVFVLILLELCGILTALTRNDFKVRRLIRVFLEPEPDESIDPFGDVRVLKTTLDWSKILYCFFLKGIFKEEANGNIQMDFYISLKLIRRHLSLCSDLHLEKK